MRYLMKMFLAPAMMSAAMLLAAASACAEGTNFTHGLSG